MHLPSSTLSLLWISGASATAFNFFGGAKPAAPSHACNHDNCLRAVIASGFTTRPTSADCSSFVGTTVTPAAVTVTSTVTSTAYVSAGSAFPTSTSIDLTTTQFLTATLTTTIETTATLPAVTSVAKRAAANSKAIPQYANQCLNGAQYASACACIGVVPFTVTAAAPPVSTATATVTKTVGVFPTASGSFSTTLGPATSTSVTLLGGVKVPVSSSVDTSAVAFSSALSSLQAEYTSSVYSSAGAFSSALSSLSSEYATATGVYSSAAAFSSALSSLSSQYATATGVYSSAGAFSSVFSSLSTEYYTIASGSFSTTLGPAVSTSVANLAPISSSVDSSALALSAMSTLSAEYTTSADTPILTIASTSYSADLTSASTIYLSSTIITLTSALLVTAPLSTDAALSTLSSAPYAFVNSTSTEFVTSTGSGLVAPTVALGAVDSTSTDSFTSTDAPFTSSVAYLNATAVFGFNTTASLTTLTSSYTPAAPFSNTTLFTVTATPAGANNAASSSISVDAAATPTHFCSRTPTFYLSSASATPLYASLGPTREGNSDAVLFASASFANRTLLSLDDAGHIFSANLTAPLFANTNKGVSWSLVFFDAKDDVDVHAWPYLECAVGPAGEFTCGEKGEAWTFQVCTGGDEVVDGADEIVILGKKVGNGCVEVEFEAVCV